MARNCRSFTAPNSLARPMVNVGYLSSGPVVSRLFSFAQWTNWRLSSFARPDAGSQRWRSFTVLTAYAEAVADSFDTVPPNRDSPVKYREDAIASNVLPTLAA